MRTTLRTVFIMPFLLLLLLLGLGCSSDDDDNDKITGPSLSAPEISETTPGEGRIGSTTLVTLRGSGLSELTASSDRIGLSFEMVTQQDTIATVNVTIGPEALPASASIILTNSEGRDTVGFLVRPASLAGMTWSNGPDLPTARYGLAAVAVQGKIYVLGGADSQNNAVTTVDILNPDDNTWMTGPALPSARYFHSAVVLDDKIYVMGGVSGQTILNSFDYLDTGTNTWTNLQSTPTYRYGAGAGASGGKVYIVGGMGADALTPATESFDLATNSWTTLASMPIARRFFGAVPVNDRVYAIGGDDTQIYMATSQFFSTDANTWSTTIAMPTARRFMGACIFLGNIVVVGGELSSNNAAASTTVVEAMSLESNTWSTVTALPDGRDTHAVVAADGKLYVIGGGKIDGQNYTLSTTTLIGQMP